MGLQSKPEKDGMRPDEVRPWFEALAGVRAEERAAALDGLRERAPAVAREVARLLQAHDRRGHFLSTPVVVAAGEAEHPVETAGAYRVKRVLSQGGMGVVYEAVRADDVFEKRVALKMIRGAALTSALQERFRVERQILASMEHPNVARILDGGETADGRPYLVMEYVEGRPIDAHAKEKELGLEARLALFLQLCAAVQFAHQHLVVHRDLKPGNIFVTEGGQVKLLDFGIAKIVSEHGEGAAAKTTQLQAMTPEYASPEQIGGQPVSTGTDVFLLGIVLYELVAGAHPFGAAGKLPHEVMRSICEEDAPAASMVTRFEWRRRLKGDFDKIAAMALQKEPGRRYASVEALAGDIRRFLTNEPVAAQGDGFGYRAGKFVRRRWAVLAGAAVVFLTMAGAAAISMRAAEEARRQRAIAEARRVEAEQQRGKAEQAAAQAIAERAEAEARKVEAERLRAVADEERARTERHMGAQRALAMNLLTTSDTQFRAGSYKDAIANLESNLKAQLALAAGDPGDKNLQKMIGVLEVRLCGMRASSGDPQGALRECKSAMERLAPIAGSGDTLLLASLGAAYGTYGKLRTNAQSAGEAVTYGRKAVRVYEELLAREPANSQHRRTIALSQAYLAQALFLTGAKQEAVATFGKSVEALGGVLRTDPADRRLMLGFASVLVMQSGALLKAGEAAPGREAMKHGLTLFQALAESPAATDLELNEYANWLVRGEFSDLWRPETALRVAQRAVRNSEEKNPGYLDTLAWAHYRMGDLASAVAVQQKALRVMEGNAIFLSAPALRKEIEEGLRLFEKAAAEKK